MLHQLVQQGRQQIGVGTGIAGWTLSQRLIRKKLSGNIGKLTRRRSALKCCYQPSAGRVEQVGLEPISDVNNRFTVQQSPRHAR